MDKVRFVWQLLSTNQKENIVKELQRKHVYIFGGGEFGTALCSLLSLEKIRVQCIFDNAEAKWYNGTLVKTITRDFYNESGGCCRCFQ